MSDDPIADLLLRIQRQDRQAFREIYAATSAKLMGVLLRILADRAEAEDALQEVFTRVWLRAARFDAARGRGMTWLISVARNHAIDRLRARAAGAIRQGDGEEADHVADPRADVLTTLVAQGEARRVVDCFGQLDPDKSAAVRGAYLEGWSYDDLARRFDVPLNTMRTWLRRSLLRLRECLDT